MVYIILPWEITIIPLTYQLCWDETWLFRRNIIEYEIDLLLHLISCFLNSGKI